ncbi:MAG: hypothetical protein JXR85_05310 [Deltaproteobacteria bacterium]|nr:hypothetical protein [Deltaproteobacteria bacterium]
MINVQYIKGLIRRRIAVFLLVSIPVLIIATAIAFLLPPIYVSKSTILVESQQIPEEYVKSTVTGYVEERLQTITQRILSRPNLIKIINEFNLYSKMREQYASEIVLEKMRKDIKLETIQAGEKRGRGSTTIAFTLSYEGEDPGTVQKVANVLASLYLEENLKKREAQATRTTQFLEQELNHLKEQIDEYGTKITKFKQAHIGELPEYNQINLQALNQLRRDHEQNSVQIRSLQERKVYLEGQLASLKSVPTISTTDGETAVTSSPEERLSALRLQLITLRSSLSEKHPDVIKLAREIAELETQVEDTKGTSTKVRRMNELRQKLLTMKAQLGTQHPDVIKLSKEIDALSDEIDQSRNGSSRSSLVLDNPQDPNVRMMKTQLETIDIEMGNLLEAQKKIKNSMGSYQQKIEKAPLIEKEYSNLLADYENAKLKYNEIMSKLLEAQVARGMEETQHGERFTIIEPAIRPEAPEKPDRKKFLLMGLFLACGLGGGLAYVRETMDHSIKAAYELNGMAHIPLLSSIPLIETDEEVARRKKKRLMATSLCAGGLCIAIIAIHFLYMPLDILWLKIQKHLMITF